MKKTLLLLISAFTFTICISQDFSNKGKDFWVGYGSHCQMYNGSGGDAAGGGSQEMVLYFTSDVTANVIVTIPSTGWTRNYVVPANTVVETAAIPKSGTDDVRLRAEGKSKKSIHITSDKPVVAYAHIYNGSISGATLLFPTNTLGKEYYSLNYTQISNQAYSYPYCFAIATEDSTILEVTPTANTLTHTAGLTFRDTLMKGDILNLLGQINGNNGVDLTGTKIKSVASATGQCKKIAVFSGSGKINIRCNNAGSSSADNYIQQVFPANAWGQKYFTVPTANMPFNFFRVLVRDPTTVVKYNGAVQGGLVNGSYYNIPISNVPALIEGDKPILVAQYITTTSTCGNNFIGGNGDPEMIYLSSVEQTIDKITLNSTFHSAISQHWINVLIKTNATSSFKIDGSPAAFTPHPSDPTYSYAQISVGAGQHSLSADSGFNAIAYGYGGAESYGYNAGTNIRDLFNFVTPINPLNISNQNTACSGTPFYFSITYPFQPTSLYWDFHGFQNPNITDANPVFDTTYLVNGKQVWRYKITTPYVYNPAGNYPVSITAGTSGSDGCGNLQTRDDTLFVFNPPVTNFYWQHTGCVADSVSFRDTTNYTPGTFSYKWYWNFGDGSTDSVRYPKHKYLSAGTYNVRFALISNVGCLSDTASFPITITGVPDAKFGISAPYCDGKSLTFIDSSQAFAPSSLTKWFWNFGDGTRDTLNNNSSRIHSYTPWGNKTATLRVETNSGCQSSLFSKTIYISPNPVAAFTLPAGICLPADSARFFDASTIADGTQNTFSYGWNFGDPPSGSNNSSGLKNPAHYYNNAGPFDIKLIVTSATGCTDSITKNLSTVFPQPLSGFAVLPENCLNDITTFTDQSNGSGSTITEWHWDFGDSQISIVQNPTHIYATPGIYTIKHWVVTDKSCKSDTITKPVIINALPTANFNFSIPSCDTKVITFTDVSAANSGVLNTWTWDFGDPSSGAQNTSALQNPTHIFSAAGVYTVKLSVKSDKGCQSSVFQKQATINPQPLPGFVLPEVCLSDAFAQFTDTSKINSGSINTWAWNFGDPGSGALNTSTLKNPQHRYNAIGNYTVTLTVTSNNNCVATLAQSFTVNGDIPVSNFTPLNAAGLCANDSVAIQNASTVNFGNITKVEIYWDNTGSPAVFQTDDFPTPGKIYKHLYPNFQNPLSKIFTIRYRAYSGASCVNDRIKTISVNAAPKVQFTAIPNACLYALPYQITQAKEMGGVPGTYQFTGPGITPTGIFTPLTAGVGTHTFHYTFTSSASCVDTASQQVTVLAPPVANFGFTAPACETKAITFSDSSTTTAGSIIKWTWDYNDGSPVDQRNSGSPFAHIFAAANNYNVKLTVTTSDQCNSIATLKVVKINPLPVVNFSRPVVCLPNANATFFDQSTISDGSESGFNYLWNFGDLSSGALNTSTQKNPSHIYTAAGPYSITLSVTSNNGCEKDTVIVYNNIHPQPQAMFTPDKTEICVNNSILFTDGSTGTDTTLKTWLWNFGDGGISSQSNPGPHVYTTAGNYVVRLTVTNNNNCVSNVFTLPVIIDALPVVDAGPDRNVLEGGTIILSPNVTGNNLQYLWTPGDFLSSRIIKSPVLTGVDDRLYTLTVTANGGCSDSDKVSVKVLRFPKIPNTFTPNSDGINDTWIIQYLETYPGNRVQVFNRYGQLVFESRGYGKPWDGTMNGKGLPFGTYYYIIEPGNGRKPLTGYVTLLK